MLRLTLSGLLSLILLTSLGNMAYANNQEVPSLAPMLEHVVPAVVNISTRGKVAVQGPGRQHPFFNDPFFRRFFDFPDQPRFRETQSLGSGVIIDAAQGLILTNAHVIEGAEEVKVLLNDEREFEAKIIGADEGADVAVIQIEATGLNAIPLANSDQLRVGDYVVAIGSPFGLRQTVTMGIVSALGRSGIANGYENYIQTDASINQGNSGGALVNLRGELVGINTAIVSRSGGNVGIGFAIPVNMAVSIKQQLVEHGTVSRGLLGVVIQDLNDELAESFGAASIQGAVVAQVMDDSGAKKAGVKERDIILGVNGKTVKNAAQLRNNIGLSRPGDKVTLDIWRDGQQLRLVAILGSADQKEAQAKAVDQRLEGATFGAIPSDSRLHRRVEGVMVLSVEPNSVAANNGLREKDIIRWVNRSQVADVDSFTQAVKAADGKQLVFNILRGRAAFFLSIR